MNSLAPIRWGILGTSFISEVMATAIAESTTSELIALGSRSIETAEAFSKRFSIPKVYNDYQQLLLDDEIDAIYIGLPNHFHKEWIIRSAQAGKHVLCEKPFVISQAEALEVISVVKKSSVFCMEALMYRYHPFTQLLKELIQNKVLGDIKLYNATYTANIAKKANPTAGGSIRNLGCYPVSLVRLLANAEPINIIGKGRINEKNGNDSQASLILTFEDNSLAVISTADDMEMCWQFDIYGSLGHLKTVSNPWLPTCENNKALLYLNNESIPKEITVTAEKSLYTYQIDAMNDLIYKKTLIPEISLMDSLNNTIVLESWRKQVLHKSHDVIVA